MLEATLKTEKSSHDFQKSKKMIWRDTGSLLLLCLLPWLKKDEQIDLLGLCGCYIYSLKRDTQSRGEHWLVEWCVPLGKGKSLSHVTRCIEAMGAGSEIIPTPKHVQETFWTICIQAFGGDWGYCTPFSRIPDCTCRAYAYMCRVCQGWGVGDSNEPNSTSQSHAFLVPALSCKQGCKALLMAASQISDSPPIRTCRFINIHAWAHFGKDSKI